MKNLGVQEELVERIVGAAQELYRLSGNKQLPTVHAVRSRAKTDMNTTNLVMREWRKQQNTKPKTSVIAPPELTESFNALVDELWHEAQLLASQKFAATETAWDKERKDWAVELKILDDLRSELANTCDSLLEELEIERQRADAAEAALKQFKSQNIK